ncbi:hypothetical protein [Arcanobacterium hippocoleae]|uniref:Membrane-bound ClpP family serine protease n=1 Tax=Arcanobacterium hippocoleae TaxID=149017 RepID=A0ABU1T3P3_9ACTO|nr:hypothetical protein [Arcanobacterium hippocoleae]MDR6939450.1 membrane-bound ClpP family serine protease [Arcanobacterium hippocoleae]
MRVTNVAGWLLCIAGIVLLWLDISHAEFLCLAGFLVALAGVVCSKATSKNRDVSDR